MKKSIFLSAALLLMGSMALTACSDDDTAAITDTELTDAESQTARAAARVLNALAEVEELPTGWASKTYDATVGEQLDDANPTVRTLAVADAAEASSYFAGITGQTHCRIVHDLHWQTQGRKRLCAAWNPKFLENIILLFISHFGKREG